MNSGRAAVRGRGRHASVGAAQAAQGPSVLPDAPRGGAPCAPPAVRGLLRSPRAGLRADTGHVAQDAAATLLLRGLVRPSRRARRWSACAADGWGRMGRGPSGLPPPSAAATACAGSECPLPPPHSLAPCRFTAVILSRCLGYRDVDVSSAKHCRGTCTVIQNMYNRHRHVNKGRHFA